MRILSRTVAVAGVLLLCAADLVDEGEVHCEEAVRHLADCCGRPIDKVYSCTAGRGCDDTRPDLDDPLATQVRDTRCDALVASGACELPPMSPKPPQPCSGLLFNSCEDLSAPPPRDLSHSPPDLSSTDGAEGDGP